MNSIDLLLIAELCLVGMSSFAARLLLGTASPAGVFPPPDCIDPSPGAHPCPAAGF